MDLSLCGFESHFGYLEADSQQSKERKRHTKSNKTKLLRGDAFFLVMAIKILVLPFVVILLLP